MSRRLQVLREEDELREIQRAASESRRGLVGAPGRC
jgi:hypothetical protein